MGKSKSLDTEDPPGDGGCLMTLEENCQTCTETDKARDLELNKEMFDVSSPVEEEDEGDRKPLLAEPLTPRSKRKFDSVRNLLEKARAKLVRGRRPSSSEEPQGKLAESDSPVHRTKYVVIQIQTKGNIHLFSIRKSLD